MKAGRMVGVLGMWAALALPLGAQAPGLTLKPGGHYAIGFQEGGVPTAALPPVAAQGNQKVVAVYRVLGASGDLQWYRIRMVARSPQGGWYTPPGTSDVWVNVNNMMWVQEVLR